MTAARVSGAANRLRLSLREIRIERSLTQASLAQALGEPQSFVSKYETGERHLAFVEVERICAALGISLAELVERLEK